MADFSVNNLLARFRKAASYLAALQIPAHAAHAGYFIVLSVFPALVLLLALLRYTGLQVEHLTDVLSGVLPAALMPYAEKLILNTYRNTSGAVVSLSAVTTLWSASRGFLGLIAGLQDIYKVPRTRGYLRSRLQSLMYTLLFLLVLVLTLVLHVFGNALLELLPVEDTPLYRFLYEVVDLRFFLLLAVQTLLFTGMFAALPGRRTPLHCSLPGALLGALGWQVFSGLYSVYVEHFAAYSNIYGSVYAVALSMLWLYFCLSILFYGAALNQYLRENMEKK